MLDCPDVELPLVEVAVAALASSLPLVPLDRLELAPEPESSSLLLLLLLLPPLGEWEWEPAVLRFLLACCRSLPGLSSEAAEAEAEAELEGFDEAVTALVLFVAPAADLVAAPAAELEAEAEAEALRDDRARGGAPSRERGEAVVSLLLPSSSCFLLAETGLIPCMLVIFPALAAAGVGLPPPLESLPDGLLPAGLPPPPPPPLPLLPSPNRCRLGKFT